MDSNTPTVKASNNTISFAHTTGEGETVAVTIAHHPGHADGEFSIHVLTSVRTDSPVAELVKAGIDTDKQQEILAHVAQQMTSHGEGTGQ